MINVLHELRNLKGTSMLLPIAVDATSVTVPAGTVLYNNATLTLTDASVYIPVVGATPFTAFGYLTKNKVTNAIEVLIDEVLVDGVDEAFTFPPDQDLVELFALFHVTIKPGDNLATIECHTNRVSEGEF